MSKRPRKSPEHIRPSSKRKTQRRPHPALAVSGAVFGATGRSMAGAGRLVARYPTAILGGASFVVALSFISANALWYQHGNHPAPMFRTRDPQDPTAFMGLPSHADAKPEQVTTFRIERAGDLPAETPDPAQTAAVPARPAARPQPSPLLRDVQQALIDRGLYDGAADGLSSQRTTAAIATFEKSVGLPETGMASDNLLAALITGGVAASIVPADRPSDVSSAEQAGIDPIAAAIMKAEGQTPGQIGVVSPDLVMRIQRGLSNLAYTNIKIDGVAGEQTRSAIRHFQKHYRLAETGEPSEAVLQKMKSIGAL